MENGACINSRRTLRNDLKPARQQIKAGEIHARFSWLAKRGRECFNQDIETGVLHEVGLRNTLEPDPDNTGVGSFRSRTPPSSN
jgi:hypothetical protein